MFSFKNVWINCCCRPESSSSTRSIIFFFQDEELGWTDGGTDDELRRMDGKDDPLRTKPSLLYIYR
jgi:hypothetical protein